jgi:hypothetical protein
MPIRRKIIRTCYGSYAINIPKSWVDVAEEETGKRAKAVDIEVNKKLVMRLVFEFPKSLGDKGPKPARA